MVRNLKNNFAMFSLQFLFLGYITNISAVNITHIDPSFWWVGMKNTELQILVYGENISSSKVAINYPGVNIKEIVSVENPNYLFIYLDITKSAEPGIMEIEFTEGAKKTVQPFELKERNPKPGALGIFYRRCPLSDYSGSFCQW